MKIKYILPRITGVILITFIFHIANGQVKFKQGYVIKQSGDTLQGFIDNRNWGGNPDKISFKENLNGENIYYTPLDIRGFSVLDEIYESAIIETEISPTNMQNLEFGSELNLKVDTAFLQAMIIGRKSLYFYLNNYGNSQFYIKTDSTFEFLAYKKYIESVVVENRALHKSKTIKTFENKKYLAQLMLYLDDCPNIESRIENVKYSKMSLESLFHFYYNCTQSKGKFQKLAEKPKAEFGLIAGLSLTSLTFIGDSHPYLVDAELQQSTNFSAGINFNLIFPETYGKWSIYNELALSSYKIDGYNSNFTNVYKYTITNTIIGYSYLKMINMARFSYPINRFTAFVNLGLSNGYGFNETNYLYQESTTFHTTVRTEEGKALNETRKFEYGYVFGMGAKYKRYSLEYRYELGNGMSAYSFLDAKTKKSFFLLGYSF